MSLRQLRAEFRPARRRLAVLSSCESNLTAAASPNEVVGLPSALLQLGFAGVVASSWKVADATTVYLMARFHQLWRDDGLPPVALNRAAHWLCRATPADLAALVPELAPVVARTEDPYPGGGPVGLGRVHLHRRMISAGHAAGRSRNRSGAATTGPGRA